MKKIYERPVMKADVYETNAYCVACGTSIKGNLVLDPNRTDCAFYKNDRLQAWSSASVGSYQNRVTFTKDDLVHTFSDAYTDTRPGNCNEGCPSVDQTIWICDCGGEKWYLEWSHHYSVHEFGTPTFFLYKEYSGSDTKDRFDVIKMASSFPAQSGGSDYNVAMVVYAQDESVVGNS